MKTLEDIKGKLISWDKDGASDLVVKVDSLRDEAIAWIKEFQDTTIGREEYNKWGQYCLNCNKIIDNWTEPPHNRHLVLNAQDPYEPNGMEESIKWIKHFFNITDEDLKGD